MINNTILASDIMAKRRLTTSEVIGLLDDPEEPVMDGSDDEDILCEEGISIKKHA